MDRGCAAAGGSDSVLLYFGHTDTHKEPENSIDMQCACACGVDIVFCGIFGVRVCVHACMALCVRVEQTLGNIGCK